VKNTTARNDRSRRYPWVRILPALVAVGAGLATPVAGALELGELTVQSRLGQPLRASIPYALTQTEKLSDNCVSVSPGLSENGLPSSGTAKISIADGVIMLAGDTPVREPMVSAQVVISCPYSANLSREYLLFIDPAMSAVDPAYQKTAVARRASAAIERAVVAASKPDVAESAVSDEATEVHEPWIRGAVVAAAKLAGDLNSSDVVLEPPQPGKSLLSMVFTGLSSTSQVSNGASSGTTEFLTSNHAVVSGGGMQSWMVLLAASVAAIASLSIAHHQLFGGRLAAGTTAPARNTHRRGSYGDGNGRSFDTRNAGVTQLDYDVSDESPTVEILALDIEIMTANNSDDYEMSIVVDATKMPRLEDVAEHDFKAELVATDDETVMPLTFTELTDADYLILEQDYEDEMTATDVLNLEIAQASAELSARIDGSSRHELPLESVSGRAKQDL
jgi:hypothetical protein